MSTRLTYTSGGLDTPTDEEFESRLAAARAASGGEPRWYARRFRFPVVEGDDDATPWLHGPPAAAAHRDD